ncbi:MAG: S-layer family protein (plasmid) [Phormidium sp.]
MNLGSAISNNSLNSGFIGNTTLNTGNLRLVNSGAISSSVLDSGGGGTIKVNATEFIEIIGVTPNIGSFPSAISSSSFNIGNAGAVEIATPKLVARNGGVIASSGLSSGNAGNITIDASVIDFRGRSRDFNSGASSSVAIPSLQVQQAFRLTNQPTGNAGQVTINASVVRISDRAEVTVLNQGTGDGGQLSINANQFFLNSGGLIAASTNIGNGGNIDLKINDSLQLRSGNQISAQAGEIGNGGNLTIQANTITILENSSVNANAVAGKGGNIQIITQGLFLAPNSSITASSQFGVSGTVSVNSPDVQPSAELIELPNQLPDSSAQIIVGCARPGENTFTVTGRGGLPESPSMPFSSEEIWQDMTDYSSQLSWQNYTTNSPIEAKEKEPELLEATGWQVNEQGEVILVAANSNSLPVFDRLSNCRKL